MWCSTNSSALSPKPSLILNVLIKMKNNGNSDYTIKATDKSLTQISKHADLSKPETVKRFKTNKTYPTDTKRAYL